MTAKRVQKGDTFTVNAYYSRPIPVPVDGWPVPCTAEVLTVVESPERSRVCVVDVHSMAVLWEAVITSHVEVMQQAPPPKPKRWWHW